MGKIIAVANQKGGVGKTTTSVNLASCIAESGKSVLLVDFDPQGNATSGCGIHKKKIEFSSYEILLDVEKTVESVIKTEFKNLSIIPATISLAGAELEISTFEYRERLLKNALSKVVQDYDYIFIDCPPSLGLLTVNAFTAAESVLVPIQCEFFALEGLSQLVNTIKQIKKIYNPNLTIEGILVTMYDSRLNLNIQVVSEIKRYFSNELYKTCIPRNVKLSEAPSYGQPINYYDRSAKGTLAYRELAKEFLARNKVMKNE